MRRRLERGVLLPLLIGYAATVLLAAWRHEIRPGFFDAPSTLALSALDAVGIPAGVAVFTTDLGRRFDAVLAELCLDVRVVSSEGRVLQLYPESEQPCPPPQPRWWVRAEQITLFRHARSLRKATVALTSGTLGPLQRDRPQLLLASLAAHFRARARAEGLAPERYALLWTESRISYRTGEQSQSNVALFRWDDDPRHRAFAHWRPDSEKLREYWPPLGPP